MVSKNKPDWLPAGWKFHIMVKNDRKTKCFVHSKTRQKFYSKPAVLRYIKNGSINRNDTNATKKHAKKSSEDQEMQLVVADDSLRQLPAGWTVEVKTRKSGYKKGTPYKCYIDPSSGRKFFSKPEVFRYLQTIQNSAGPSGRNERRSTMRSSIKYMNSGSIDNDNSNATEEHAKKSSDEQEMQLVVVDDSLKQLPAGWTVEVKTRQSGAKKGIPYKCYIDPSSGSKFFSKPEVFRYLQTIQNRAGPSGQKEGRCTRHSSSKRPVDQLKNQESIVEPNVSQISKTPARRRLSSGKKEVVIENTVNNVDPNVSQISETAARRRPSSGKKEVVIKDTVNNVEPNASNTPETPARRRLSSRKKEVVIEDTANNVEPNASRIPETPARRRLSSRKKEISKTPARRLSSGKKEVVIENTVDEDLPSGWIKEMRKKVHGTQTRTDPFYFHPASGLVFRSKVEVLHYLETGEISRHAYRRRKSRTNIDIEELAIVKTSSTPSVNRETTTNRNTIEELFSGEETSKESPPLIPEAKVVKEAAVRRITRSSSRVRPAVGEAKPDPRFLLHEKANMSQEASSMAVIVSPQVQDDDVKNTVAVSMKSCSNKKVQTTKGKTNDQKLLNEPSSSRSSKRLAGIDALPVFHSVPIEHALQATSKKSIGVKPKPVPSLVSTPNDLLQDKVQPSDAATQNAPVCQPAKHFTFDVSSGTVLATEEEPWNNSDSLVQNAPPVFSKNAVTDLPPVNTGRSSENSRNHPILEEQQDALPGSKTEKSLPVCPVPDGQPGSTKDTEQSGTEFSFPPPLWSDPCLEFAYKTLTGAIPFDDNLAIEDYIQHQLRTSKQSNDFQSLPDIDMASFLQNEETKQVPPLPEGIRLPNGNGLAPPQNEQVKG